ncbi:hypothetical protein Pryu01_02677 [Paraliobacillus ryukyuensis]|uniref:Uncharacterized protein DUF1992 n=1 Tax=Paraliobacillus ryukyuensis TaxID=200904 RepID=A0A366DZ82_9BACI|nr:DnaJ family domain-containing protein [Paraliobacillus ryukyuensis]RBO95347.1 uncharacterized protein DUF1992 [Paraliobacillus ryukyuensis]
MDFASRMAEEKIREAMKQGSFDHLEGKGKPQQLEDLSHIPAELRMGYHLMKNSDYLPEEIHLHKELLSLREMVKACDNDEEKQQLKRRLTEKELRYRLLMEKRGSQQTSAFKSYQSKINQQLFRK